MSEHFVLLVGMFLANERYIFQEVKWYSGTPLKAYTKIIKDTVYL